MYLKPQIIRNFSASAASKRVNNNINKNYNQELEEKKSIIYR